MRALCVRRGSGPRRRLLLCTLLLVGPAIATANASSGLRRFLERADAQSPELRRLQLELEAARAVAETALAARRPLLEATALGPSYASVLTRQFLFEGADYVTTDAQISSLASALELRQLTRWGGLVHFEGAMARVERNQVTTLPPDLTAQYGDLLGSELSVDAKNLQGDLRFSFTQPLFSLNAYEVAGERAAVRRAQADLSYEQVRNALFLRMAGDYLAYQAAVASLARADARLALFRLRFDEAELLVRDGQLRGVERQVRELDVGREVVVRLQALDKVRELASALSEDLGQAPGSDLPVEADTLVVSRVLPSPEQGVEQARARRWELRRTEIELDEGRLEESEARDRGSFQVDLIGSAALTGFGQDLDATANTLGLNDFSFGVRASLPLWDGGAQRVLLDGLRAELKSRELDLEIVRRRIESEVRVLHQKHETSLAMLDQTEANLALARRNARLSVEQVKAGLISQREADQVHMAEIDLSAEVVAARARVVLAGLEVHRAMGDDPLKAIP